MVQTAGFRALPLALCLALLAACEQEARHDSHFYAMGTRIELTLYASEARSRDAKAAVEAGFEDMEATWDGWNEGALGRLNRALEQDGRARIPDALMPALAEAIELGQKSRGLFHPGIGRLTEAWGFHRTPYPGQTPPDALSLQALRDGLTPVTAMAIDEGELQAPGLWLDPGGFVKGLALGRAAQILREQGIENALINAGGDIIALGEIEGRPWHVGILHPRQEDILAGIRLSDGECILSSGDYERGFEHEGQRYHHLLDPRTGQPARASAATSVLAHDCARADAAATALFVAGPGEWPAIARSMGVDSVLLVDSDGGIELSPAMASRLEFRDEETDYRLQVLP